MSKQEVARGQEVEKRDREKRVKENGIEKFKKGWEEWIIVN